LAEFGRAGQAFEAEHAPVLVIHPVGAFDEVRVAPLGDRRGIDALRIDETALAVHLVDGDGDVAAGLAHHQHALAFVQHGALALEELLEVDHRQQGAAHVGHAQHPRLRTGHRGERGHRQDLDHFVEARRKAVRADPVGDAAPQARGIELLRKAGDVRQAALLEVGQHQVRGALVARLQARLADGRLGRLGRCGLRGGRRLGLGLLAVAECRAQFDAAVGVDRRGDLGVEITGRRGVRGGRLDHRRPDVGRGLAGGRSLRLALPLVLATLRHGSVPNQRVDPLDQVGLARRLDDVVLRALAQAPHLVRVEVLGAHDQHRDVAGVGIARQRAGGLEPVHARQHDIHQDQVRLVAPTGGDPILGVAGGGDLVPVAFQQLRHDRGFGR
jgi:hypothetical protein